MSSAEESLCVVGTTNSLKVEAIGEMLPWIEKTIGLQEFESNVSEYPEGKEETIKGAKYRATYAKEKYPNAHLWIGVESGFLEGPKKNKSYVIVGIYVIKNEIKFKNKNENNKNHNDFIGWSYVLECPITHQQRIEQIQNALKDFIL